MSNTSQEILIGVARRVRDDLEPRWAGSSDHALYWPDKPLSYAQCAKSIPSLLWELRHSRAPMYHHLGKLAFSQELAVDAIAPHQWLEVDGFVLDITGDQHGLEHLRVVCATPEELQDMGLLYEPTCTWKIELKGHGHIEKVRIL